jgi:hypothetical protein
MKVLIAPLWDAKLAQVGNLSYGLSGCEADCLATKGVCVCVCVWAWFGFTSLLWAIDAPPKREGAIDVWIVVNVSDIVLFRACFITSFLLVGVCVLLKQSKT